MSKSYPKHFIIAALFTFVSLNLNAQSYWAIGAHGAFPQNNLKKTGYSNGGGIHFSAMNKLRPINKVGIYNYQFGLFSDFSWLGHRNFGVMINTPVPDNGKVRINNTSASIYSVLRNAWDFDKYMLYADLVFGFRSYYTQQTITAENPELNPDYQSVTTYNDVVFNNRFHKGIAGGFLYRLNPNLYADFGFTYSLGAKGLVQPLKDIYQEGNELRYKPTSSNTDILLIKAGIVFKFNNNGSSGNGQPSSNYGQDDYNTNTRTRTTTTGPRPTPAPKKQIEIKPNSDPKKNNN